MTPETIRAEIKNANLMFLMLTQSLLRTDPDAAVYRLGITEETAKLINGLTMPQLLKLASSATLLFKFRNDDELLWQRMADHSMSANEATIAGLHSSILSASRYAEAA